MAITERRTKEDFARQMRWLVDTAYPDVPVVRLALDNLNTHRKASLYQAFPAEEARRIAKRLEFHCTAKHGSWLNMAEIEFSVFSRSRLRQRLPDGASLCRRFKTWSWSGTKHKPASTGAWAFWTPEPNSIVSIRSIPELTGC